MCNHVVAWKFWYNPVGSLKFVNNLVVDLKNREIWGQSWCNPLLTGKSPKKFLQPCTWWKWDKNLCTTLYYTGFCIILLFWPICAIFSHLCHLCLASVPSVLSVPICACLFHLGQPSASVRLHPSHSFSGFFFLPRPPLRNTYLTPSASSMNDRARHLW